MTTYRFILATEPKRIISAVIMDARFSIPALNRLGGFDVKLFVDAEIAKLSGNVLPYKIETSTGSLAGYFTLQVDNIGQNCTKISQFLRPAFQPIINDINQQVNSFVSGGGWKADFLL